MLIALLAVPLLAIPLRAEDWPQWRGPRRDGAWTETHILKSFPSGGLKIRWRVGVGAGFSSPVVSRGRVFLSDVLPASPKAQERMLCSDAASGKPLWVYSYEADYPATAPGETPRGPIPTPVVDAGKVYMIGKSDLVCLDVADGTLLWKKALDTEYNVQEFLTYASPLIEGDLLIILAGRFSGDATACVIALDKDSGATVWRAVTDYASMSSPIVVSAAGKRQLIVWTQQAVTSLDPVTGNLYWREPTRPLNQSSAVATPVAQGNLLLISGLMMRLDEERPSAAVLWPESKAPSRRTLSNTSTPLLLGDYVYSANTSGSLVCLNAATGEEVWRTDKVTEPGSGASIHLTPNGDRVFIYNDKGELILANLSPAGYEEMGRTRLLEPTSSYFGRMCVWPPPAYADRCVFARSDKQLVCASLAE